MRSEKLARMVWSAVDASVGGNAHQPVRGTPDSRKQKGFWLLWRISLGENVADLISLFGQTVKHVK